MTQVLIAPVLMLMMWTRLYAGLRDAAGRSAGFMDTFISTTLVGLEAQAVSALYFPSSLPFSQVHPLKLQLSQFPPTAVNR
jgi:hypothetical protein